MFDQKINHRLYYRYSYTSSLLALASLLLVFPSTLPRVMAQGPHAKTVLVKIDRQLSTDPLIITHVFIGDDEIKPNSSSLETEQWLNDLRITVHNKSLKAITAVTVDISFPESGDGTTNSPIVAADIKVGNIQSSVSSPEASSRAPLLIAPGEGAIINVTPDPASYTSLLASSRLGSIDPSVCFVRLQTITFEDGTRYFGGAYQRRDRAESSHFSMIPSSGYLPPNQ